MTPTQTNGNVVPLRERASPTRAIDLSLPHDDGDGGTWPALDDETHDVVLRLDDDDELAFVILESRDLGHRGIWADGAPTFDDIETLVTEAALALRGRGLVGLERRLWGVCSDLRDAQTLRAA